MDIQSVRYTVEKCVNSNGVAPAIVYIEKEVWPLFIKNLSREVGFSVPEDASILWNNTRVQALDFGYDISTAGYRGFISRGHALLSPEESIDAKVITINGAQFTLS